MSPRGALVALFLLSAACRQDPPQQSAPSATASALPSPSVTAAPAGTPTATVSQWEDANTPQPVELANAPARTAVVVFDARNGGYIVERGDRRQTLPREWFGAGPPRRDLSISSDGSRLAVPEGDAVVVYDVSARRWLARLAAPRTGALGKMTADGKHVRWTAAGAPCSMTEIETKTIVRSCP